MEPTVEPQRSAILKIYFQRWHASPESFKNCTSILVARQSLFNQDLSRRPCSTCLPILVTFDLQLGEKLPGIWKVSTIIPDELLFDPQVDVPVLDDKLITCPDMLESILGQRVKELQIEMQVAGTLRAGDQEVYRVNLVLLNMADARQTCNFLVCDNDAYRRSEAPYVRPQRTPGLGNVVDLNREWVEVETFTMVPVNVEVEKVEELKKYDWRSGVRLGNPELWDSEF